MRHLQLLQEPGNFNACTLGLYPLRPEWVVHQPRGRAEGLQNCPLGCQYVGHRTKTDGKGQGHPRTVFSARKRKSLGPSVRGFNGWVSSSISWGLKPSCRRGWWQAVSWSVKHEQGDPDRQGEHGGSHFIHHSEPPNSMIAQAD